MIISEGGHAAPHPSLFGAPCTASASLPFRLCRLPLNLAAFPSMRLRLQAGPDILETFGATTRAPSSSAGPWAKERNLFAWFVSDESLQDYGDWQYLVWHAGQRAWPVSLSLRMRHRPSGRPPPPGAWRLWPRLQAAPGAGVAAGGAAADDGEPQVPGSPRALPGGPPPLRLLHGAHHNS